jgi:hypothetical protein
VLVGLMPVLIYGYFLIGFSIFLFKRYRLNIPIKILISLSILAQLIVLAFKV